MPTTPLGPGDRPRPIDALLAGYAAGALHPYLHALIEAHLILSDENRARVRAMEEAAADEIEEIEPRPIDRTARDAVLGAIYAGGWYGRPRPVKHDPEVPDPLDRLIGMRLDEAPWRFAAPGLKEHVVARDGEVTASLIRIKPGRAAPRHTHAGQEVTLVLKGAFFDPSGVYRRGDVAVADAAVDHRPVAEPGGPCICFAVSDAPLKLTGPIGRLLQKAFGR